MLEWNHRKIFGSRYSQLGYVVRCVYCVFHIPNFTSSYDNFHIMNTIINAMFSAMIPFPFCFRAFAHNHKHNQNVIYASNTWFLWIFQTFLHQFYEFESETKIAKERSETIRALWIRAVPGNLSVIVILTFDPRLILHRGRISLQRYEVQSVFCII